MRDFCVTFEKRLIRLDKKQRYVDADAALARVRGNVKVFKLLLATFLEDEHFLQLVSQIELREYEAASRTVHAIKGVAANLSLPELYELSVVLEGLLKSEAEVEETFAEYSAVFAQTRQAVEALLKTL